MSLKIISLPAMTLILAATLPGAAYANTLPQEDMIFERGSTGVLFEQGKFNRNLAPGDDAFAKVHARSASGFFDQWTFSLADASNVSIDLHDLELAFGADRSATTGDTSGRQLAHRAHRSQHNGYWNDDTNWGDDADRGNSSGNNLLDNKFMSFNLFDQAGRLLGSAGEGDTLTAINLLAGQRYTLTVTGITAGIFGGAYYGNLSVQPVPLTDSLPLFASALALLVLRRKKTGRRPGERYTGNSDK